MELISYWTGKIHCSTTAEIAFFLSLFLCLELLIVITMSWARNTIDSDPNRWDKLQIVPKTREGAAMQFQPFIVIKKLKSSVKNSKNQYAYIYFQILVSPLKYSLTSNEGSKINPLASKEKGPSNSNPWQLEGAGGCELKED